MDETPKTTTTSKDIEKEVTDSVRANIDHMIEISGQKLSAIATAAFPHLDTPTATRKLWRIRKRGWMTPDAAGALAGALGIPVSGLFRGDLSP